MDLSLSEVPFLEIVTAVFLMSWMDFWQVDHLRSQLNLGETLVDKKIILLMHSTVAALAGSAENLKTSSKPKYRISLWLLLFCQILLKVS